MSELPRVTVVMPVRNEERYIERSLGSVLAQGLSGRARRGPGRRRALERPDPGARRAPRPRARTCGVIDNPRGIVAPGLNAAIAEARGEVVVRVDGHCEIAPEYLSRAVALLRAEDVAGVGGPIETVGETPLARAIATVMSSRFGVGGSAFRTGRAGSVDADTIPFPAYPKAVLEEAGPFDEELVRNQDDEYNYRLRRAGRKLLLASDLSSRYYSRADLASLWRQHFQYGYWKVRVMQKHPRQMRARQFAPPALVAALALGVATAPWSRWGSTLSGGRGRALPAGHPLGFAADGAGRRPTLPAPATGYLRRPAPGLRQRVPGRAGALRHAWGSSAPCADISALWAASRRSNSIARIIVR